MPDRVYAERVKLSDAVTKAVQAVYSAKLEEAKAIKERGSVTSALSLLADARTAERRAVHALDKHRKEHGC